MSVLIKCKELKDTRLQIFQSLFIISNASKETCLQDSLVDLKIYASSVHMIVFS